MKSLLRTSSLAVLVASAFALPAGAQIRPPVPAPAPTGPINGPVTCPTPTLATCQDPIYLDSLCGKRLASRNACAPLLSAEYKRQYDDPNDKTEKSTVFTPLPIVTLRTPLPSDEVTTSRSVYIGKRVPFDPLTLINTKGEDTTFAGMMPVLTRAVAVAESAPAMVNIPQLFTRRPAWRDNGGTANTCAEYVWDKYYDYSRFEDSARLCGASTDCVYNVAYFRGFGNLPNTGGGPPIIATDSNVNPGFPTTETNLSQTTMTAGAPGGSGASPGAASPLGGLIGGSVIILPGGGSGPVITPGIAYRTLSRADGTPMQQLELYQEFHKNAFYKVRVDFLRRYALTRPAAERAKLNLIIARLERDPKYLIGPSRLHKDEWAWHEAMHDAQLPLNITPGERVSIERRTNHMTKLLHELAEGLFTEEAGLIPSVDPFKGLPVPNHDIFSPQDPWFFLSSLDHLESKAKASSITKAFNLRSTNIDRVLSLPGGAVGSLTSGPGGALSLMMYTAGSGTPIRTSLPPILTGILPNQTIGDQVVDLLVREWDRDGHGCLGEDNRCDWSSRMFAERFVDRFQFDRQRDFERCQDATPPTFGPAGAADGPAPTTSERSSTAALEGYFTRRASQFGEQLKDVPVLVGGAGALPKIGKQWVGGQDFGFPEFLGATYNYDVGWNIEALEMDSGGNVCRLGARANAKLFAQVTYPQKDVLEPIAKRVLVDTDSWVDARGGVGSLHSHFKILGDDLYKPINVAISSAPEPIPEESTEKVLIEVRKTVILFGVPVTGALKATAKVGFSGSLAASGGNTCDKNNPAVKINATFKPYAQARANAYLMIGVPGIGAGVEGELEIIRAELPANASAGITTEGTQTFLEFHSDAALDLHALSGRVEAYAEVCIGLCARASTEIFAWDGWHQTYPLVNMTKKVELLALRNVRR